MVEQVAQVLLGQTNSADKVEAVAEVKIVELEEQEETAGHLAVEQEVAEVAQL